MSPLIDARALSKLKWRCRRGLLENDLFIQRFFVRHQHALSESNAVALGALMELGDNDLLDLLLRRTELSAPLAHGRRVDDALARSHVELALQIK